MKTVTIRTAVLAAAALLAAVCGCDTDRQGSRPPEKPAARTPLAEGELRAMFLRTTDIELPADARCVDGQSVKAHCELGDILTESVYMVVEAPEAFKADLAKRLRVTSNKPEWVMTSDPPPALPAWDLKKMEGMKVYTGKTARRDDGWYYKFSVAFDDRSPAVYVTAGEVVPPARPPEKKPVPMP